MFGKQISRRSIIAILLAILTGCSVSHVSTPLASTENSQNDTAPLKLDILNESNTDGMLTVQGEVITKIRFNPQEIGVRIRAIDGKGETIEAVWLPTATMTIDKGEKLPFTVTIPVKDITDYQVEVLWGDEAKKLTKKETPKGPSFVALRNLKIQRAPDPGCKADPCLVAFQITGEIFNSGNDTITGLSLLAGLVSVPEGGDLDLQGAIPQNERRIEVKNLALEPGGTKPLKLQFDEMYDAEVAQYLKPTLRIISVATN